MFANEAVCLLSDVAVGGNNKAGATVIEGCRIYIDAYCWELILPLSKCWSPNCKRAKQIKVSQGLQLFLVTLQIVYNPVLKLY